MYRVALYPIHLSNPEKITNYTIFLTLNPICHRHFVKNLSQNSFFKFSFSPICVQYKLNKRKKY